VNPLFVSKSETAKLIVPAGAPVHASGGEALGGVIVVCPALKQIRFIVGDLAKSLPVSVNAPAPDASLPPPSHPAGGHCPASVPPSALLPELLLPELPEAPELLELELELLDPLPLLPVELPLPLLLELALPPPSAGAPPAGPLPESLPHIARKRGARETPATAMRRHILQPPRLQCVSATAAPSPADGDDTCARVPNVGYFAYGITKGGWEEPSRPKIPVVGHRSTFGSKGHCVPGETAACLGLLKESVR
jgi:hypothetical protein